MEVYLKKAKITGSILTQTLDANTLNLKSFEVLGFCLYKGQKWLLFYKSSTNELRKYPFIKKVLTESEKYYDQILCEWAEKLLVRVNVEGMYTDPIYRPIDEQDANNFIMIINNK